ncbi:MAG TPA: methyltransferase domain-containing protein [Spirochaetota bacterium]|nr:methyltransferase domain-containing protein [Spirochaetota bacterium]
MRNEAIDGNREFNWGLTSKDYGNYRKGYPPFVYDYLSTIGIGVRDQRILDMGTGTGNLAREFAKRGSVVTGVDASAEQIGQAVVMSRDEKLDIEFIVGKAEECDFANGSFDAAAAGQSWMYFDARLLIPKLKTWLIRRGSLVLMHFNWLPHEDRLAEKTEELVLRHNPSWTGAGYRENRTGAAFDSLSEMSLMTFQKFIVPVPFTSESWRGRMRSCRGIGACADETIVARFDRELDGMLSRETGGEFDILHEISIHVFRVTD